MALIPSHLPKRIFWAEFTFARLGSCPSNAGPRDGRQETQAQNDEQARQAGQPSYLAHISLDRATIRTETGAAALEPGMAVTAEIGTGRRTAISYLLSPLQRLGQEGLRER